MREFVDDDQGFLRWKATHGDGYVRNTTRRPRTDYLMLHRATCPTLERRGTDLHWTKDYIKVCADQIDELRRWAERHVTGIVQLTPCGRCRP